MKKTFIIAACAATLAACGGGGDKASELAKLCVDEGGSTAAECECMATAAVEKLDGDMVDMLLVAAKAGDDSDTQMAEMMGDMSPEQMQQFMTFAVESSTACGVQ